MVSSEVRNSGLCDGRAGHTLSRSVGRSGETEQHAVQFGTQGRTESRAKSSALLH